MVLAGSAGGGCSVGLARPSSMLRPPRRELTTSWLGCGAPAEGGLGGRTRRMSIDFPNLTTAFTRRYNEPALNLESGWQYAAEENLWCRRSPAANLFARPRRTGARRCQGTGFVAGAGGAGRRQPGAGAERLGLVRRVRQAGRRLRRRTLAHRAAPHLASRQRRSRGPGGRRQPGSGTSSLLSAPLRRG